MITDESLLSRSKAKTKDRVSKGYDNVTEVLLDVIQFTQARHKLIIENIRNAKKPGFQPKDLPSQEFAAILNVAINEHVTKQRLVFHDTDHVHFGCRGLFDIEPVSDREAFDMLVADYDAYIKFQTEKLNENSLHQRFAAQLLKQKHSILAVQ